MAPKAALLPSSAVSPLVAVLSAEQEVYEELLTVANEERSAIVDAKLPTLKLVVERKQEVLARLSDLEERRASWVRRYARRNELDVDALTLTAIIDQSEGDDRRLLLRLHRGLTRRIQQLVEVDRITRSLLEAILKSIDTSLHYLLADDAAGQTYAPRGRSQSSFVASRQLLDRKA